MKPIRQRQEGYYSLSKNWVGLRNGFISGLVLFVLLLELRFSDGAYLFMDKKQVMR